MDFLFTRYVHETNLYIDERDMSRDKNEKDLSLTRFARHMVIVKGDVRAEIA